MSHLPSHLLRPPDHVRPSAWSVILTATHMGFRVQGVWGVGLKLPGTREDRFLGEGFSSCLSGLFPYLKKVRGSTRSLFNKVRRGDTPGFYGTVKQVWGVQS